MQNNYSAIHIHNMKDGEMSGVSEIKCFDDDKILLVIETGQIEIIGENFELTNFDKENGNLIFSGDIFSVSLKRKKVSLLKKFVK